MQHSSPAPPRTTFNRQYLAVFSVSIGALAAGSVLGYSSPALYQLRHASYNLTTQDNASAVTTNPFDRSTPDVLLSSYSAQYVPVEMTPEMSLLFTKNHGVVMNSLELSWFSSVYGIGALVGGIISSPMQNFLGRRGAMLASVPLDLVGWLLLGVGASFPVLVVGRLLTGMFTGVNSVVINTYVGEITSSDVRGRLGCSFEVMFTLGMLFSYGLGAIMTWYDLALVHGIPPTLFAILMLFNYESPVYLISKGRDEEAKKALQFFKGPQYDISIDFETEKMFQKEVRVDSFSWRLLHKPFIYRPLVIASTLAVLKQLSGINVVTFNLATIFQRAGTGFSEHASSAISVSMQLLAAALASTLIEKAGRKPLLMGSFTVMAAMLGCLGLFFFLLEKQPAWTDEHLQWLPLLSVSGYLLSFGMGIGSICWVLIGELFPPNVRESAGAFVIAVNDIATFFALFTFELQDQITSYGYYWTFAAFCLLSTVFCGMVFKETKGKTLEEISLMFGGGTLADPPDPTTVTKRSYGSRHDAFESTDTIFTAANDPALE